MTLQARFQASSTLIPARSQSWEMSSHKSLGGRPVSRKFWTTQFSLLARMTRHQEERKKILAYLRIGHARDEHVDLKSARVQECKREMWVSVRACACETCPMAKTPSRQPITRCLIDKACVLWIVSA